MDLILASSSPYRQRLLRRLGQPFDAIAPDVNEKALPNEPARDLAARLAADKARAVSRQFPSALVIGSDQVAALGDSLLGKPGNHPAACEQLQRCSGREVVFYTGLTVACEEKGLLNRHVEPFTVHFRTLSERAIENYLRREQPYDCAGSFKCEGLGITLFERLNGDDPTSLEGLPLISLTSMLLQVGYDILS